MKLIKPSFSILEQEPGLNGIYKAIERAGRVSYKSEDKITEDSAKPFVDRMVNSGHGGVLEHGTVYLRFPYELEEYEPLVIEKYVSDPYTHVVGKEYTYHVTSNYRVLVENGWLDDLKYLCEPTQYHAKRITVKFICDRGVSHEFVRHRVFSFLQESTRYCNYSKKKFNNEVTFIIPPFADAVEGSYKSGYDVLNTNLHKPYGKGTMGGYFYESLRRAEEAYIELTTHVGIDLNIVIRMSPQQARAVLPNALKTELVMTGFADDWWGKYVVIDKATGLIDKVIDGRNYKEVDTVDRDKCRIVEKGFFPLRCSSAAHPQAQELAIPLREEFIKRGY